MQKSNRTYNPEIFMHRCLELAANGLGSVAPNPMVGAVIVCDEFTLGEGYHQRYGEPHAEVNAINSVKDQSLLKKSTLYVNLEPCAHMGKTPPCSDLIINRGIPRVVIGTSDPNSLVAGRGIEKLKKNGIEVVEGILVKECRDLNRRFFTFHEKKRPYIILKWAQTADGFMDVERNPGDPIGINWISNTLSQTLVHKWRSEEQAIMAGSKTVLLDDPRLTVRHWRGRSPIRVLLDNKLQIPSIAKVMDQSVPTLVLNRQENKLEGNTEWIKISTGSDLLERTLQILYEREILSVIVEGGKILLESLLARNLWDEARVLIGKKTFGKGLKAPEIELAPLFHEEILQDKLLVYTNYSG
jgi:diaminohydroxyphosphoribosylaminopyrimidine deaminase/5-amino-6-(5-phosphoribosylamino)uracil reductase